MLSTHPRMLSALATGVLTLPALIGATVPLNDEPETLEPEVTEETFDQPVQTPSGDEGGDATEPTPEQPTPTPETESEPEHETEPDLETEDDSEAERDSDPKAEHESEPDAESESDSDSESPGENDTTLEISGVVVQVAGEPSLSQGGADEVPEVAETMIATDDGPVIAVDTVGAANVVQPGDRIEEVVEVSEDTAEAAAEAAEDPLPTEQAGQTDEAQQLERVAAAAEELGESIELSEPAVASASAASSTVSKAHSVDLVYFHGGSSPSSSKRAQLERLIRDSSTYWNRQTEGYVPSAILSQRLISSGAFANSWSTRCDSGKLWQVWSRAAQITGRTASQYLSPGSGNPRHLVVMVDDRCGQYGNTPGWGTIGSLHSGGMTWINVGTRGSSPMTRMTGTVAHELGHNLGLGHSNARHCIGSRSDSKVVSGRPTHPCRDVVYGDPLSVMGQGNWLGGTRPPVVPISSRYEMGVLDSGDVRTVTRAGGTSQEHYISNAAYSSGRRGLRIVDPRVGTFFVETRAAAGLDDAIGIPHGAVWKSSRSNHFYQSPGVRVTRAHLAGGTVSTVLSVKDRVSGHSGRFQTLRKGARMELYPGNVRITVKSVNANGARVRVEFRTFNDAPFGHPFESSMAWMKESGIFTGTRFTPEDAVTRQIAAVYLYRAQGRPAYTPPSRSYFRDVPTSHPYYKEIMWLRDEGIFRGSDPNGWRPLFKPTSPLTRAAMAAFMMRASHEAYTAPSTPYFRDVGRTYFVYKEIWWMRSRGLFKGPNYWPNQHIDKQVFAVFLHRWKT